MTDDPTRRKFFYYDASWRLLERRLYEDTDPAAEHEVWSPEKVIQNFWGLEYIDQLHAYQVDAAATGGDDAIGDDFTDASISYALTDRKYDVIGIVDELGERAERVRYTSYGESKTSAWTTADIDGDFAVGGGDFAAVYTAWGRTAAQMTTDADRACDVNADGIIDNADVSAVLSAWGRGGGWGGPAGVAAGFGYGFGAILSDHFVINEVDAYYRGQAEILAASTCSGHAFRFNGWQRDIYTMLRDNKSSCDTFGDGFQGGIRVVIGEIYEQFRN